MITGYSIIIEDEILYCSNEAKYNVFEIVLFVEKLITSINPKLTWRLNNILLKGFEIKKERILFKHFITENKQNLFYCIIGDFKYGSQVAKEMMEEFYEKVTTYYKTPDLLQQASEKEIFSEIIEVIVDHLWEKYENLIENEEIDKTMDPSITNNILYCGISSQGLPIISQVYSRILLDNLGIEINEENVDLLASNLSAKLATIAMNAVIRSNTNIREIHLDDLEQKYSKKAIIFGDINGYTLDFLASGDFFLLKRVFKELRARVYKEEVLKQEFAGDLKPYRYLHDVIGDFYKEGL